jgi:DNA-binding NarL/FixJ family response regulator
VASATMTLSAHEHRIAVLAAGGCSNRTIGDRLDVCSRAVEHHLTSVYRKLEIGGRRQLPVALRGYSRRQDQRRASLRRPPRRIWRK